MATTLAAINAGLAAAQAVTPEFVAATLKPHAWYLARFIGSESEPADAAAVPYKFIPGRSGMGSGVLKQGYLTSEEGVPKLHARWYEYPARFEIGPEMTEGTVISWLLDAYAQRARKADLSALTSLMLKYTPELVSVAHEKYPGLLG